MAFNPRTINKELDFANLAKHNDNYADIKTELDAHESAINAHIAAQTAHGSTAAATPGAIMQRDSEGRAKVAAPAAADDIARKAEVDAVQEALDDHIDDADVHLSEADRDKLDGIEAGAQPNQNAFAQVNNVVAASESDTLTIAGGTGITISTNPTTKTVTVTATGEATPGPHGSSHDPDGSDPIPELVALRNEFDALTPASIGAETPAGAQAKVDALAGVGNTKTVAEVAEDVADVTAQLAETVSVVGKVPNDYISLVTGLGTPDEDWTQALQALIDDGRLHRLPVGRYRITDELVIKNRRNLEGSGNTWNGSSFDTVIFYDGVADPNKAVIRASHTAIGVEPTSSLINIVLKNLVLDGNGKAGYGLYTAYVTDDSVIENITAINTTQHGIRIEKGWFASYKNLVAKDNLGCGITIGRGFDGWASTSKQVNSVYISNLRAHNNGLDQTFDKSTNKEWGYGIGLYTGYNLKLRGITSENNDGAGLVFKNPLPNCGVDGAYFEGNDKRGTDDKAWAIIYIGESSARGHFLRDIYLWGEHANTRPQSIWLTGTRPSPIPPLEIKNANYGKIRADWDNYTLQNAYYGMSDYIEGHIPQNEIVGGYTLTTLYVRNGGDDNNDGRSASTAFATLSKAVQMARYATRVATIDCTGATITEIALDFSGIKKQITITGGTTATVTNTTNNRGLEIINARYGVTVKDFSSISRLLVTNSNVQVENCTLALSDSGAWGVLYSRNSDVRVTGVTISKGAANHGLMTGLDLLNSKVAMESITINSGFSGNRYVQLRDGSTLLSDTWLTAFDNSTIEDAGYMMGGNKMKNKAGTITFV